MNTTVEQGAARAQKVTRRDDGRAAMPCAICGQGTYTLAVVKCGEIWRETPICRDCGLAIADS